MHTLQHANMTKAELADPYLNEAVIIPGKGLGVIVYVKTCEWLNTRLYAVAGHDDLWIETLTREEIKAIEIRGDLWQTCLDCHKQVRIDHLTEDGVCPDCQHDDEEQDESDDDQYPDFHVSDFLFERHMRAR